LLIAGAIGRQIAVKRGRSSAPESLRTAIVEQKDFIVSSRIHGIVEAVESHTMGVPRLSGQGLGTLTITKLIANGGAVRQGDVLVEFDREAQLRNVLDKQAEYQGLVEQIKKKEADQAANRAADETALKQAEDAEKTAELEVSKKEILSKIDAEKNDLNLEQAQATLRQLRETFDLKRRADKADLRILEIQRDRAQAAARWAQGNTGKMVIHSPVDGIAVLNSIWKGNSPSEVHEGDDVRSGLTFMQVVNPRRMQVRARVNQADIYDVREGQNAQIRLDAYPDLSFSGKVDRIGAIGQTSAFSNKARTFTVLITIEGSAPQLLPDLSAAVDVQLVGRPNALVVPRDAIVTENNRSYVAIKNGRGFERRKVELGEANDVEQVVVAGIEKGATVLRNVGR
jgi:HlyD family secretion protein